VAALCVCNEASEPFDFNMCHAFHIGEGRFVANLSTPCSVIANLNNEKINAFAKAPHFRQPLISNW